MKRFIVLAALLAAYTAVPDPAIADTRGARMYMGADELKQFSNVFQGYLDRDPSGKSLIDAKKCATYGDSSCGTGVAFLEGILAGDPHATVEGQKLERVSQIPAFLRKLELRDPESGEYWSDCMVRSNDLVQDPSGWKRHPHCARNEFKPGEKAIVDPDTGVTVMKQGCHNTGVQKVAKAHCVDDIVYAEEGETVLLDEHGPRSTAQEACTGLKRAGETDFESPWLERCAHPYCSLRVADRYAKYPEQNAGSFYVDQSGWFIVRHPAYVAEKDSDYQYFYCRHRGRSSACAVGIRWFDYLQAKNPQAIGGDERAAVVYPSKEDLDRAGVKTLLGADSALWWDFNRADCPGR